MNDDPQLEALLRELRPAPLPDRVCHAMKHEPPSLCSGGLGRPLRIASWMTLAASIALLCWLILDPAKPATDEPVITLNQSQTTLLNSRQIAVVRLGEQIWELAEQDWVERELTLCSAAPISVSMMTTRRELVWQPVIFD